MKTCFLSVFMGLFIEDAKKEHENITDQIFLTSTEPTTQRTLIVEGNAYSVWVYVLSIDKESVDFEGYLCSLIDPKLSLDLPFEKKNGSKVSLPASLANSYSYVKDLNRKDIKVVWNKELVSIYIKNTPYLVMNLSTKMCYSKALSKDCSYGNALFS